MWLDTKPMSKYLTFKALGNVNEVMKVIKESLYEVYNHPLHPVVKGMPR